MYGAEALVSAAVKNGIKNCFANPGTTEMPLVQAMDSMLGLRSFLCLHENVATGAADGYGRMTGHPAMCLLHLGPGLANGLTNLHNARRAFTPVLNVIGEHATWHLSADPLLATDIETVARNVRISARMAIRGIDLFCGAGGDSWGATAAGVRMVGAIDQWEVASRTYADNFPSANRNVITTTLSDSIGPDVFKVIGRIDLLIASPECTHHSLARGARPRCGESQRSGWYISKFIEELSPEHIVL